MQSINLNVTFVYGMSKDLINKKEEIKYNSLMKQHKDV